MNMEQEYELRAVKADKLVRLDYKAENDGDAIRHAHRYIVPIQVPKREPWLSGKIVVLNYAGQILATIDNLNTRNQCDCGDCSECDERNENE